MNRVKRMLMVRFSSIGDMVFTTPVVRCAKKQLGWEIHYLTKEVFAPVVGANPFIDKVIAVKKDIHEVVDELKAYEYDWIADLHHNLRTARLKMALRRPGASFPKLNIEKYILTNFHYNILPDIHVVDRCFETVKELGVVNDNQGYDFFIPEGDEVDIVAVSGNQITSGQYVAMAIGANLTTRQLEEHQWQTLIQKTPHPVVLIGGPGDRERGERLAGETGCLNLAGKLKLTQSASVAEQSAVVVSGDTGLLHISCALKKRVVSYWGSSIPGFGVSPYFPEGMDDMYSIFETNGLRCRPCSKIGRKKCPKGHFKCIRQLDIEAMVEAIDYHFRESQNGNITV